MPIPVPGHLVLQVIASEETNYRRIPRERLKSLYDEADFDKRRDALLQYSKPCSGDAGKFVGALLCDGTHDAESWHSLWDNLFGSS